jgi:hypothetical protein
MGKFNNIFLAREPFSIGNWLKAMMGWTWAARVGRADGLCWVKIRKDKDKISVL